MAWLTTTEEENPDFAEKLKQDAESSYKRTENTPSRANGKLSFSSSVASVDPPTEEQKRRIRELVGRGFSERSARIEILAPDHAPGCECEVCL